MGVSSLGWDKSEDNMKKIVKLEATLDNLEASKRRGANKEFHVTSQQQVSRKELYDITGWVSKISAIQMLFLLQWIVCKLRM